MGERIKFGINLVFGNGTLVPDQTLQICDFFEILLLQTFDVLFRDLDVTFEFEDVNQELTLVSQLILVHLNHVMTARIVKIMDHIEIHGVLVRLLHDLSDFIVQVLDQ